VNRLVVKFSVVRLAYEALDGSDAGEGRGVRVVALSLYLGEL
jgi:hypothetical protein